MSLVTDSDDNFENQEDTGDQTIVSPIETISDLQIQEAPSLLMISGEFLGRSYTISHDEFMMGRISSCDLQIEEDLVSRHHCKIITKEGQSELVDLASTNGTLLNGRRVDRAFLKEGDQIQVGASSILKYHLRSEVESKFLSELYEAATKDFLTNVYNKKFFMDRLQTEFAYTRRHEGNLSVIVLDIDHFKKVNDTYGHLLGDMALQKVGHHLAHHTRKDDLVARFGGEEFVVLMRDCDLKQAKNLAENLRKGISEISIQDNQHTFKITVSIGVANLSRQNQAQLVRFEKLIQRADENLYRAKTAGRNRVCA